VALGPHQRPTALAYRALGLGDLLTAVPALRGLRSALPRHRLVLATTAGVAPLGDLVDAVDETLVVGELAALPAGLAAPDVAVNLHGRGPQSTTLLAGLRPRRLVSFADPLLAPDGARWRAGEHEVSRWCRLVEDAFEVACRPDALDLARPSEPSLKPGAILVHPGAASGARRWPVGRFAEVCASLAEAGDIVVTGSAAERPEALAVARRAGLPERAVLAGRTDIRSLAALVASARLVVCGDTGLAHLASAYRTPSVVLFGPTSPTVWGPPDRPQHVVIFAGTGTGDPHAATVDPALLRISASEVVEAARALLSSGADARPPIDRPRA